MILDSGNQLFRMVSKIGKKLDIVLICWCWTSTWGIYRRFSWQLNVSRKQIHLLRSWERPLVLAVRVFEAMKHLGLVIFLSSKEITSKPLTTDLVNRDLLLYVNHAYIWKLIMIILFIYVLSLIKTNGNCM